MSEIAFMVFLNSKVMFTCVCNVSFVQKKDSITMNEIYNHLDTVCFLDDHNITIIKEIVVKAILEFNVSEKQHKSMWPVYHYLKDEKK